ncbi:MAG: alpha/beta hydrolase [Bacteroidales bacterium]|nr:alpha/beta hydrolase [Bacteroidales bacterium]
MIKKIILLLCLVAFCKLADAQNVTTHKFVERDSLSLFLDIYRPSTTHDQQCCIIHIFGGGFMSGQRNTPEAVAYAQQLNKEGFTVVTIDYRLGLKGVKIGNLPIRPLEKSIQIAVEDLMAAVHFLLENGTSLQIPTQKIVLSGSSAGAIVALQADYELCNRTSLASVLPADFLFSGVMSFSGAIFSRHGKIKYKEHRPAPTLFLHGTNDRLVNYKQTRFFNIGFFGTYPLSKQFKKADYPFYAIHYQECNHEVAGFFNTDSVPQILWFLHHLVLQQEFVQINEYHFDPSLINPSFDIKPNEMNSFIEDPK